MLHPDLSAARFLPRPSLGPRALRLIRRARVPAARVPEGLAVTDVTTDGPGGRLRVRLYRPQELERARRDPAGPTPPAPALLWLHGGGYVLGWPEQDDRACLAIAGRLRVTVASVDYRLAPEHPFPAALDDAHAALAWLVAHGEELGVDPDRIAVGGSSAGGGLAAALAQRVHDEARIRPAFQLLVYPMLDDRTASGPATAGQDVRVWTPASNRFGWSSYLGAEPGATDLPPYAVPARRADLTGLAPAWIGVGTEDLFLAEDSDYARRLEAAGVPTTLLVVPGAFHGFDSVLPRAGVSRGFLDEQVAALAGAFLVDG